MTKCHSCQLALLRAIIDRRNRLEEKKAPVEKVVEKVKEVVVPVAADPLCDVQALHGAYQAGWHDRDVELEQFEHLLSISDRRVKLLQHDIERLKERIEDLESNAWELEIKEES
jgi:vacuolar-type H+-ATPase subunit E/Vma4